MGNTPSQEAPRRPQKLTKTQLSLQEPASGLFDFVVDLPSQHGRCSSSYLVGSVPISPSNSSPTDPKRPGMDFPIAADQIDNRMTSGYPRPPHREPGRWSNVSRTWSFRSDESPRRYSMIASNSRPRSMVVEGNLPLTRSQSLHTTSRPNSVSYDVKSYEVQRLMSLGQDILTGSAMSAVEDSPVENITENTWKISHPTQPTGCSVDQTNPDPSMYLPVRRRSIIQTPGVATRAQPSDNSSSSKSSSFRSAISTTPEETRHNSIESDTDECLPPTAKPTAPPPERVVTPCEAEYKVLGGIKFGSLRIVNGSPRASPRSEKDIELHVSTQPSFDREPTYSTAVPLVSNDVDSPELMPRRRYNTYSVSNTPAGQPMISGLSGNRAGRIFPITESVHDSSTKPTPEKIKFDLESKTFRNLSRSDSGLVSSPSSEGSRRTNKTDSGYSSSVSLRSLRSLRSAVTDFSRKSPERQHDKVPRNVEKGRPNTVTFNTAKSGPARPDPTPQQPSKTSDAQHAASDNVVPTKSSSHRLSSLTGGRRLRMPSLRSNRGDDAASPPIRPRSRSSPGPLQHKLGTINDVPRQPQRRLTAGAGDFVSDARIQRSAKGSQRRGPPKVRDNRPKERGIPSRPKYASNTIAGGRGGQLQGPSRPWLRDEKSEDTLRTILSVGSTDMLSSTLARQRSIDENVIAEEDQAVSPVPPIPPTTRRKSLRRSITQVATAWFSLDRSSASKAPKEDDVKDNSDVKSLSIKSEPAIPHVQYDNVSSTAGKPVVGPLINHARTAPPKAPNSTPGSPRGSSTRQTRPSTAAPTIPPRLANKASTTTTVSTRTQTSKGQESSRAPQQAVARRSSATREVRREQVHSYPPAQNPAALYPMSLAGAMSMTPQQMAGFQGYQMVPVYMAPNPYQQVMPSPQVSHRRTRSMPSQNNYDQSGRTQSLQTQPRYNYYPPRVQYPIEELWQQSAAPMIQFTDPMAYQQYNAQMAQQSQSRHRRAMSQGSSLQNQEAPFRVLHSYNSPAYRGVPIWG